MLHYLSFVWNETDPAKRNAAASLRRLFKAAAPDWEVTLEQDGLAVYHHVHDRPNIDEVYLLPNRRGVILGKLFERSYAERSDTNEVIPSAVKFDERSSSAIVQSAGRSLLDHYWGRYIAFLRDPGARKCWVLRDPTGSIPCQRIHLQDIDVYFWRLEDCAKLNPPPFSINLHFVLGYLMYDSVCVRETGLNEVETVLPGECIEHHGEKRKRSFYWNPLEIADKNVIEDASEAVRLIRRTVRASVHAWASCYDNIMLELSGGLDSSIVASCLADAPTLPNVTCRNFYMAGPVTDERNFAHKAANRAGFELIEEEVTPRYSLESIDEIRRSICPFPWWTTDPEYARSEVESHRRLDLQAIFRGDGGDELFFQHGRLPTAVDYAWRHGLRPSLLSTSLDDATAEQVSVWQILRAVHRFGLLKRPFHMRQFIDPNNTVLTRQDVRDEARRDIEHWHPLYQQTQNIPPGKYYHAYLLTFGSTHMHTPYPIESWPEFLTPLSSQPVTELSLRIPMYILRKDGQDRAVARRAFAEDVPQEIIQRQWKVYGTDQLQTTLLKNIHVVRELLMDGLLVRENILNREKLEAMLSGQLTRLKCGTLEIAVYLNIEGWARAWRRRPQPHASVAAI